MCTIFKSAIRDALPQARLVVDHFHLVQLANQAVTEVPRRAVLHQREEAFHRGVVTRRVDPAHRAGQAVVREHEDELSWSKLRSAVGVHHAACDVTRGRAVELAVRRAGDVIPFVAGVLDESKRTGAGLEIVPAERVLVVRASRRRPVAAAFPPVGWWCRYVPPPWPDVGEGTENTVLRQRLAGLVRYEPADRFWFRAW
jgi:hypothetical protein